MLPTETIIQKRDGKVLADADITAFIQAYVSGDVTDYQASAFLMAAFLRGLNFDETAALTRAMMESGEMYDLTGLAIGPAADKHSTGGVGDKTSLALAPLAASCGIAVPMVSGRGLGHTGGTLDKLEAIPGFQVSLLREKFFRQLEAIGVAMIGQSDNFVPADKKLYALRDVTGTVESVPLICASILSKKIASGAGAIVMDVKTGSGAFMATLEKSRELAGGLCRVGEALGRPVRALITGMSQPLGRAVGNSLETREAIECLRGEGPDDLRELVMELSAEMLLMTKKAAAREEAIAMLEASLESGAALEKFREMIQMQDGDPSVIDDLAKLDISPETEPLLAERAGYVSAMDCREIGLASLELGAGRRAMTDVIDHGVGLIMQARLGDQVEAGQPLATVHHRAGRGLDSCMKRLRQAIVVADDPPEATSLIQERIS